MDKNKPLTAEQIKALLTLIKIVKSMPEEEFIKKYASLPEDELAKAYLDEKHRQEGDAGADGGQMGHGGQVRRLLDAAAGQHGKAGLTAVHHIGVVAEDGERMGAHGTGRHVQHAGQALAGDAVHGGDHQHQALGRGEAGGQSTGLQRTVTGAAGAGLGLHLHQTNRLAEDVLLAVGRPRVGVLRHRAGGCDGVDGCDLGERIGDVCRRLVAVADLHDLAHMILSSSFLSAPPCFATGKSLDIPCKSIAFRLPQVNEQKRFCDIRHRISFCFV